MMATETGFPLDLSQQQEQQEEEVAQEAPEPVQLLLQIPAELTGGLGVLTVDPTLGKTDCLITGREGLRSSTISFAYNEAGGLVCVIECEGELHALLTGQQALETYEKLHPGGPSAETNNTPCIFPA